MKLVLKERVENLGEPGDIVDVKPGYGRNYLVPKGFAIPATEGSLRQARILKAAADAHAEERREEAEALAERLGEVELTFLRRAPEESDTLYGSVTASDIAEALAVDGFEVEHPQVRLGQPLKALGEHGVEIGLPQGVVATVRVQIEREEDAAADKAAYVVEKPEEELEGAEAAGAESAGPGEAAAEERRGEAAGEPVAESPGASEEVEEPEA